VNAEHRKYLESERRRKIINIEENEEKKIAMKAKACQRCQKRKKMLA